jgi:hypothetical protein
MKCAIEMAPGGIIYIYISFESFDCCLGDTQIHIEQDKFVKVFFFKIREAG